MNVKRYFEMQEFLAETSLDLDDMDEGASSNVNLESLLGGFRVQLARAEAFIVDIATFRCNFDKLRGRIKSEIDDIEGALRAQKAEHTSMSNFTEAEILQVLQEAHPDEIPMSPEQIVAAIKYRRDWVLKQTDISEFAAMVDAWMRDRFYGQASQITWIVVIGYLEKVRRKIRREMAALGMVVPCE